MANTDGKFAGQRALITGGTKGIGKAVAHRLARQGAHVVLNYAASSDAAEQALAELRDAGYSAQLHQADIGRPEQVSGMLDQVLADGPLDMLICNAAYEEKVAFLDTDEALMRRTLEVNVFANFQLAQTVSRNMIDHNIKGRIVIATSPHGTLVFPDAFAYDVSKAALNHMTRCMALPLLRHGIRVNAVDIGWTVTPGERRFTTEAEQYELSKHVVPLGRPAQPDEMAAVVEFLCSDEAGYIAGSIVLADGGYCLAPSSDA